MKKTILTATAAVLMTLLLTVTAQANILGDIDGDLAVEVGDARLALRTAVGLDDPTPAQKTAMDADHDGEITVADARLILRNAVGLEDFRHYFGREENSVRTVREPTCGADGLIRIYCSCGMYKEETLPAAGDHSFSATPQILRPATCTEDGAGYYVCAVCGLQAETTIPAAGHKTETIITAATCTGDGEILTRCTVCDFSVRETIPARGHRYTETYTVDKAPTCLETGIQSRHCVDCGGRIDEVLLPKVPHVFGTWSITPDGSAKTRTCMNCEETQTEPLPPRTSDPSDGEPTDAEEPVPQQPLPEETTTGPASGEPTEADPPAEETTTSPAPEEPTTVDSAPEEPTTAHVHSFTVIEETPATCSAPGRIVSVCTLCGEVETALLPATGHRYILTTTVPPGCTEAGADVYTCELCGNEEATPIPATGHTPETSIDSKTGATLTVCGVCGTLLSVEEPAAVILTAADGAQTEYSDLSAALESAAPGSLLTVFRDATLEKDAAVPAGVTLWLPCETAPAPRADWTIAPDGTAESNGKTRVRFRTLTIPAGITLTINGTLVVDAQTGRQSPGPGADQDVSGNYAAVELAGTMEIADGGTAVCHGVILPADGASGGVQVRRGAALYETLSLPKWRGMTYALHCADCGIWPIYEAETGSVRTALTIESGGTLSGCAKTFAEPELEAPQLRTVLFPIIGAEGVIRPAEAAVVLRRPEQTADGGSRTGYLLQGGAVFSGAEIFLTGVPLRSSDFTLPLNGDLSVTLENGVYTADASFLLLPGASLTVGTNAALTLPAGRTLAMADDRFREKDAAMGALAYPADRTDAALRILQGGTVTTEGALGGLIQNENGTLNADGAAEAVIYVPTALYLSKADMEQYKIVLPARVVPCGEEA